MKFILFTLATLVACASRVSAADPTPPAPNNANPPVGTFGHTTVLANNTIFIQGGLTSPNTLSKASYAIILDHTGSIDSTNVTFHETSTLSKFAPRNFGVAFASDNYMVTCGMDVEAKADMSCDQLDVMWYNKTNTNTDPPGVLNRAGMAVAYQKTSNNIKAYFIGGYGADKLPVATVNIVTMPTNNSPNPQWSKVADATFSRKFHTATWVDGAVDRIVVLGGQQGDIVTPLTPAYVYAANNWTTAPLTLTGGNIDYGRYGHSAVSDGNGNIYIFGGFDTTGNVRSDLFIIDTRQKDWSLKVVNTKNPAPEGRVFHTATMLPDKTMLIMWGQSSSGPEATYMVLNLRNLQWSKVQPFGSVIKTTISPNTPPPPPPGKEAGSGSSDANIPLIAGLVAAGVVLLFLILILILIIRRRNRRNRPIPTYHPNMMGKKDSSPPYEEEEDKAKQAKAFMIRRPPSVYMVDDQDHPDMPQAPYKSQYYGDSASGRDSPSVAEYELHNIGGGGSAAGRNTLSTVGSVDERRRYVEEQQRQFREGYENAYNHPPPFDSNSHRDYDMDDDEDETLSNNTRRGNGNDVPTNTGPRYPRAETSTRGGQPSGYEHPANDYFP
ncbi:hypothetical protein BGZ65_002004 [Modicella reniformis]|uniref:Galactose oxidase n=1 Tax=Modicella reniformis TaxID=1440133 RepID=A0A9P6M0M7_9FUNG|nr:hypothetical protein BGZ65_002004 [Modicella reniformis]